MKSCLFIAGVLCVFVLVNCEPASNITVRYEECAKELGISEESISGPPNWDEPEQKCFYACLSKKAGNVDTLVKGKMVLEREIGGSDGKRAKEIQDKIRPMITDCVSKANGSNQKDECEVVAIYGKCLDTYIRPPKRVNGTDSS